MVGSAHYSSSFFRERELVVQKRSRNYTLLGMLLLALGVILLVVPFVSTIGMELLIGAAFVVAGVSQATHSFKSGEYSVSLLLAALYILIGGFMLLNPVQGAMALTALLAGMFLIEGILTVGFASKFSSENKGWTTFSGVTAFMLGLLLFIGLPSSSLRVPGLLVGLNFITSAIALLVSGRVDTHIRTPAAM